MTTDINAIVAGTMAKMTEDGSIEQLVSKATEASIQAAVKDTIGGYKFRRQIEEAIEKAISVDLQDLGLPGYNLLIANILKDKLGSFFEQTATEAIHKQMDELLAGFPTEVKTSKLFEDFREHCREDIEEWESGECTILVEQSDSSDGYFRVYFDKEASKSWHRCEYGFACDKDGRIYSLKINEDDVTKKKYFGPCGDFERFLFHAYTNKIRIELDETDPDTQYGRCD